MNHYIIIRNVDEQFRKMKEKNLGGFLGSLERFYWKMGKIFTG